MIGQERPEIKTPGQVRVMRRAGLVVADALAAVREAAQPGATTGQLDGVAARVMADAGATSSFLGHHGFPAVLCTSVNDEVVHGIPGDRELRPGDVLSVDCGAVVDGWHGDAAFTMVLEAEGPADAGDAHLVAATEAAMWAGLAAVALGGRLGDVGAAVEDAVRERPGPTGAPLGIVEGYTGHGIGSEMHQPPDVLNHRSRCTRPGRW